MINRQDFCFGWTHGSFVRSPGKSNTSLSFKASPISIVGSVCAGSGCGRARPPLLNHGGTEGLDGTWIEAGATYPRNVGEDPANQDPTNAAHADKANPTLRGSFRVRNILSNAPLECQSGQSLIVLQRNCSMVGRISNCRTPSVTPPPLLSACGSSAGDQTRLQVVTDLRAQLEGPYFPIFFLKTPMCTRSDWILSKDQIALIVDHKLCTWSSKAVCPPLIPPCSGQSQKEVEDEFNFH